VLIAALTAGTLGMLALAQASVNGTYVSDVLGPFVLLGLGLGPVITALSAAATDRVSEQEAGLASGLINTTPIARRRDRPGRADVSRDRKGEGGRRAGRWAAVETAGRAGRGVQLAFYLGGAISAAAIAFAALGVWVGRRASG
jgi:hypothetical protein